MNGLIFPVCYLQQNFVKNIMYIMDIGSHKNAKWIIYIRLQWLTRLGTQVPYVTLSPLEKYYLFLLLLLLLLNRMFKCRLYSNAICASRDGFFFFIHFGIAISINKRWAQKSAEWKTNSAMQKKKKYHKGWCCAPHVVSVSFDFNFQPILKRCALKWNMICVKSFD